MTRDLVRRLTRLESDRGADASTMVLADHWLDVSEAEDALKNWREWVARDSASADDGVLCIAGPELTRSSRAKSNVGNATPPVRSRQFLARQAGARKLGL